MSVTSNTTGFTFCFANKLLEENIYILSTQIFHLLQGLPLLAFVDYCSSLAHQFEHAMIEGLTYTHTKKKKTKNTKQKANRKILTAGTEPILRKVGTNSHG